MPNKTNKNKKIKKAVKAKAKPKAKLKVKRNSVKSVVKTKIKAKNKTKSKSKTKYKAAVKVARKKRNNFFLTFGDINPERGKILVLIALIIFVTTVMIFSSVIDSLKPASAAPVIVEKNAALKKEIAKLVQGYPIAKMTPYIAQQDPKTAAFLIAIAKKESNWGKRKPVLNGKDCYNYWGFRLQAEDMGSGGHTCFDSPKEAVEAVASRIDEMVQEEKIDSPKEMIVWKCGYGCLEENKTASEQKWISDVNMYYKKFSAYL